MRNVTLVVVLLVVGLPAAFGQAGHDGPVIPKAASLVWDDTNPPGTVTQFRMYCQVTPNVVVDAANLVGTIDAPLTEWVIDRDPGQAYCVVTATDGVAESEPSNEVPFYILNPPSNQRIVR